MASNEIFQIRRALAAGAVLSVLALAWALLDGSGDGDGGGGGAATDASEDTAAPTTTDGILPEHRVVAFYGAPQDPQLGVLGIGTPEQAAAKLERQARPYERGGRPVLPAFELIATIAAAHPGADGLYRTRQPKQVIRRYLDAAREAGAILILDIQPGHADFLDEVRELEEFLREPDVSLALDPEWATTPPAAPGQEIGSIDAETINRVQYYLVSLVAAENLPDKLLVVHQFTDDMIENRERLRRDYRGVDLVLNVDGFGNRALKRAKYRDFTSSAPHLDYGFKLFYEEDTNVMQPRQVLALDPRPQLVVYE